MIAICLSTPYPTYLYPDSCSSLYLLNWSTAYPMFLLSFLPSFPPFLLLCSSQVPYKQSQLPRVYGCNSCVISRKGPTPPSHQLAPTVHPLSLLRCSLNSGADTRVPLGTKQSLVQPVTRHHPPTEAESCTKLWVHIELFRRFFNDLPI